MLTKKLNIEGQGSPKSLYGMQEKRFCHSILLEYSELADLRFNGYYKFSSEMLNLFLIGKQFTHRLVEKNKLCKDSYTKSFASKPGSECINLNLIENLHKTEKYIKGPCFYNNKENPTVLVRRRFL